MSTGIEALRAPRQTAWPFAVFALLVAMTLAIIATTMSVGVDRPDARFVGRHLVNTPTELAGGVIAATVSETAVNTPSELRGARSAFVRHVPRPAAADRAASGTDPAAEWPRTADAVAASERYDRHQRI